MNQLDRRIEFQENKETMEFVLPTEDSRIEQQEIIWRKDPLTGRFSLISKALLNKSEILFGQTDYDLLARMAEETRKNCFFCKGAVETQTPRYPPHFIAGGRLKSKHTILFPNLFPLSKIHAVLTFPASHFLGLNEFSVELLSDLLVLGLEFIKKTKEHYPDIRFISLNANHLMPAGASVFHPHFQILGSQFVPQNARYLWQAMNAFSERYNSNFWDSLLLIEKEKDQRWIAATGRWNWITAFAPQGSNEILAVHDRIASIQDLQIDDMNDFACGLSSVLNGYHAMKFSSYNFSMMTGDPDHLENQRVTARIVTRQNFRANYRNDDYYLQKLLGAELISIEPEMLASTIRRHFK